MSSRSYIIPADYLTYTDKANYRINALASGICRAYDLGIMTWDRTQFPASPNGSNPGIPSVASVKNLLQQLQWPANLDVRELQPILDAGCALDQWNTAALAAVGTEYSVFQAVPAPAIALRTKRLVVFYKVQIETTQLPVSRLLFRRNGAAGILQAEFDLEQLAAQDHLDGFFSEPVIWDNNTAYAINVMARIATGALARVQLGNYVFEPAGTTNA